MMQILLSLFVIDFVLGVASSLWVLIAGVRMMWHFKSPADAFSRKTLWNPMNALLAPDLLTPRGLTLRRHVGYASLAVVISLAFGGGLGLAAYLAN